MNKINCAVYVRKSTERGLEQEFNSLHNQEEACKAYIASQTYQGWEHFKTYEDGGISGGTMERPGLRKMLDDIKSGKVNIVVVYKVDRLSRSIMDFHHMMEEFKKYDCNFVSVTQAFDTSNSMGKLTLNMLLSFAQFEREVSSERVRDKIAATKAKGLWAGGMPIIGYDVVEKQLVVNEAEAPIVNEIFKKYLEANNMLEVCAWIKERGILTKRWTARHSKQVRGGKDIEVSYLHRMLRNPIYIGKIQHMAVGKIYEGKHQAIVPLELFQAVQDKLGRHYEKNAQRKEYTYSKCLFKKTLFDDLGNVFGITSTKKERRRFYYYSNRNGYSLPMGQLDEVVLENIQKILEVDLKGILPEDIKENLKFISNFNLEVSRKLVKKAICTKDEKTNKISVYISISKLIEYTESFQKDSGFIRKKFLKNDGGVSLSSDREYLIINLEFVLDNSKTTRLRAGCSKNILTVSKMNETLVRGIAYGWKFSKEMEQGKTATELEKESGLQKRRIYKYVNLKYLSPKIVKDIFENKNPRNFRLKELLELAEQSCFVKQEKHWNAI
ncbi:MAG: recombinase family protein [Syntrophomonadaceae bacterium]|jgi:DNA invertase Pin-like site-specific DNA recombinase|nr:recombinase family protein [Syntrophomonadaceae bacterium]